jgi:hypothetical protein
VRDELGDWMADKHVGLFDVAPEVVPDIILRRTLFSNKITSDLDVGSVENRAVGSEPLDHGNKTRHLRIINLHL